MDCTISERTGKFSYGIVQFLVDWPASLVSGTFVVGVVRFLKGLARVPNWGIEQTAQ